MKKYKFENEGRQGVLQGINKATDCVAPTLGAIGKKALLDAGHLDPIVADDGAKILNMIDFQDRWENMGNRLMRKIVNKMHHRAGSGRTTSAVLSRAFCNEAQKEIKNGTNSRLISERLEKGLKKTLDILSQYKHDIDGNDVYKLALTESNDEEVAKIIAQAIQELGRNGVITVEESNKIELSLETVKGMRIKSGLVNERLINDSDKNRCVLDNPYILIADRRIATNFQIKTILEEMVQEGRTDLLIVAMDVEGEALASIIMNHERRAMNTACIQAPYKGDDQHDFLYDLAVLTGGDVISEQAGLFLDKASTDNLGQATSVIVDKEETIISGGQADEEKLEKRINVIKEKIKNTSEHEKKVAEKRLAGLTSGVGVIKVGAFTSDELRLRVNKIEDAINSTRLSLDEGVIAGGGSDLLRVAYNHDDEMFKKALQAPFYQMVKNAGMEDDDIDIKKIIESNNLGYDFVSTDIVDMYKAGILDPFKVERIALETAISIAKIFADTAVVCAEFPEEKQEE